MVKRVIEWVRAPEPRTSYEAVAADAARRRERERARDAEWRRLPGWIRLAPLAYYVLPVLVFFGYVHGQWTSALILAGCGVWMAAWPLEFWWRRRRGDGRTGPTVPDGSPGDGRGLAR